MSTNNESSPTNSATEMQQVSDIVDEIIHGGSDNVDTIDLTIDEKITKRAIPDFSKLRGPIYDLFKWSENERMWMCSCCKTALQHHPKFGSSTLRKHFKDKHPTQLSAHTKKNGEQEQQATITKHLVPEKPKPQPVTKEGVRIRLAKLVVGADLPFNITEDKFFVDFVSYVTRQNPTVIPLPGRSTVKLDIEKLYQSRLEALISELRNNEGKISLIVDCWTSSNQNSYQGVVATWVDNSWKMQSCVLDLSVLEGSHTGENLAIELDTVMTRFDLWPKIMAITTDNATNMNTMFEKLDELALEKGSDFESKNFRVRCLAHIINLSCKQLLGKAESATATEESGGGALKKLRSAIAGIRGSPQRLRTYESSCQKEGLKVRALLRDVPTRWNSTFDMLVRAREMKAAFERTLASTKEIEKYTLSEDEWRVLDSLVDILRPFKEATILISTDRPTLSDTSGAYQILFAHLEKYMDNEGPVTNEPCPAKRSRRNQKSNSDNAFPDWLIEGATTAWDKLKDYYTSSDALIYTVATVMDPRFKLDWFKALEWPQEWQKRARRTVISYWERNYKPKGNSQVNGPNSETADSSNQSLVSVRGSMFEEMFTQRMKNYQKSEDELLQYLAEPVAHISGLPKNGILGWWENNAARFQSLSKMAKDVLSVHGTGVSVERFFSSGPDLLDSKRQRITAESVRKCLALKAWVKRNRDQDTDEAFKNMRIWKSLGVDLEDLQPLE